MHNVIDRLCEIQDLFSDDSQIKPMVDKDLSNSQIQLHWALVLRSSMSGDSCDNPQLSTIKAVHVNYLVFTIYGSVWIVSELGNY